ncbi:hypothetical protein H6F67_12745 [Microcoleus sp. FACHB-1515]|uniref:hypothetical protein n=1 Tax=Cyanophyceae TaxID=3028117 RepID=UPI001685B4EB|nr:hypothetical protein [Microcoleus sp. FACHB-1515]MBD2090723.1 hypothetical protein [Microcoleus sp. FACHB-1515]
MQRMIAIGLAIFLGGCLPQAEAPTVSPAATTAAPEESIASPTPAPTTSPDAAPRTATFNVEGEPTQVELERYETPQFIADIPEGQFVATPESADDGTGVRFKFSPTGTPDEQAYVQVFFPNEALSADDLTQQLIAPDGLLASNGWKTIASDSSPPYDWARSVINYEQPNTTDDITGRIYVGEHEGKAFLVYTHYPIEYAEGFIPRADLILESFEPR